MEYCSTIKRNEVVIHATTWTNPENIRPNKNSQSQKAIYFMIPFILNAHKGKPTEAKNRSVVREVGERRNGEWLLMGTGVSFREKQNVLN